MGSGQASSQPQLTMSFEWHPNRTHPDHGPASGALAIRIARLLNLICTWGLPATERADRLAEADADWEAMQAELGSFHVLGRALRGTPAWIWDRLTARDTTTLPAAAALALVAVGGLTAGLHPVAYPVRMRILVGLTAGGLLLSSLVLLMNPRRLVLRRFGLPALASSIGFVGLAFDLPPNELWQYSRPVLDHWTVNGLVQTSLLVLGVGFAISAVNAVARSRRLLVASGTVIVLGLTLFASSQIIWGVWVTSVDFWLATASIMMGLAALSWAHVMPRLRHLELE